MHACMYAYIYVCMHACIYLSIIFWEDSECHTALALSFRSNMNRRLYIALWLFARSHFSDNGFESFIICMLVTLVQNTRFYMCLKRRVKPLTFISLTIAWNNPPSAPHSFSTDSTFILSIFSEYRSEKKSLCEITSTIPRRHAS